MGTKIKENAENITKILKSEIFIGRKIKILVRKNNFGFETINSKKV